jgi:hyperosmotically inducible protein
MNEVTKIPTQKLLLGLGLTAALGLALPALAAGSPTYTPSSSMKTPAASTTGSANVMSDSDITNQVKSRLSGMNNLRDSSIDVNTMKGEVTLTGTVTSKDEESAAKSAAQGIPGVKNVKDDLKVSSTPPKAGSGH